MGCCNKRNKETQKLPKSNYTAFNKLEEARKDMYKISNMNIMDIDNDPFLNDLNKLNLDKMIIYLNLIIIYLNGIIIYLNRIIIYLNRIIIYLNRIIPYLNRIIIYLNRLIQINMNLSLEGIIH